MDIKQQYIDLFRQHEAVVRLHAPECMNLLRSPALEAFELTGFPSLQHEDYRHTDVEQAFAPDYGLNLHRIEAPILPGDIFRCAVPQMRTHLFFVVNDSFYMEASPEYALPDGVYAGSMTGFMKRFPDIAARYYGRAAQPADDAATALNTMLAQDGFVLYVPEQTKLDRAVQLVNVFRSAVDIMANRRILIIIEPHAEARLLVCDHSPEGVKCLATQVVEIFAGRGAVFDYYDLEESSVDTTRFASLYANQEAYSNVLVNGITLNNGLTRNNYRITLNGEAALATLCGMAIQDQSQQVDSCTQIIHAAPKCKSRELFKYVLNDRSAGVFNGRILVEKGAEKTEALQTNRNMCKTRQARMYSRPQLEIYADDVKCSHGMTTGQLDESALFYMQSRGISRDEAKTLLSVAFTADIIENVRLSALKDRLRYLVEKRFRGELVPCAACYAVK